MRLPRLSCESCNAFRLTCTCPWTSRREGCLSVPEVSDSYCPLAIATSIGPHSLPHHLLSPSSSSRPSLEPAPPQNLGPGPVGGNDFPEKR